MTPLTPGFISIRPWYERWTSWPRRLPRRSGDEAYEAKKDAEAAEKTAREAVAAAETATARAGQGAGGERQALAPGPVDAVRRPPGDGLGERVPTLFPAPAWPSRQHTKITPHAPRKG